MRRIVATALLLASAFMSLRPAGAVQPTACRVVAGGLPTVICRGDQPALDHEIGCEITQLAPGTYLFVIYITSEGDVIVLGAWILDCPPYGAR